MRHLVKDFTNHPLLPGSVVVAIMEASAQEEPPNLSTDSLQEANRSSLSTLVETRLDSGFLTDCLLYTSDAADES